VKCSAFEALRLLHCKHTMPAFYLVRLHQRASPLASGSSHLITAYYLFIDPVLVDLQRTVYPCKWLLVTRQLQAIGKVRRSETDVLPLSYTTNQSIGTIDEIFGMICVLI